jgi:hypothetical protein
LPVEIPSSVDPFAPQHGEWASSFLRTEVQEALWIEGPPQVVWSFCLLLVAACCECSIRDSLLDRNALRPQERKMNFRFLLQKSPWFTTNHNSLRMVT